MDLYEMDRDGMDDRTELVVAQLEGLGQLLRDLPKLATRFHASAERHMERHRETESLEAKGLGVGFFMAWIELDALLRGEPIRDGGR